MRQAGLAGRCKRRWRKTTIPDPAAERARDIAARSEVTADDVIDVITAMHEARE